MKSYQNKAYIFKTLFDLKQASTPGKTNDGAEIRIRYNAFGEPTERAKEEARKALEAGCDPRTYTGRVDRLWFTKSKDLILTMLVLERLNGQNYCYRSFNLMKGDIQELVVF